MGNLQNNCTVISGNLNTELEISWVTGQAQKVVDISIRVPGQMTANLIDVNVQGSPFEYKYIFMAGGSALSYHTETFRKIVNCAVPAEFKVYQDDDAGGTSQAHASALL